MSKFGRRTESSKRSSFGSSGKSYSGGSGYKKGGFSNKSSYSKGKGDGGGKNEFIRIGTCTVSKSTVEQQGEEVIQQLQESGVNLWFKPYFKKGVNSVTLTRDSKVLISFKQLENGPDYVVATVSIANEE